MLEKVIIENCAPTLANLKTGEIVNYKFKDLDGAKSDIQRLNKKLTLRGVNIEILCEREESFLLYVYREKRLEHDLSCPIAKRFLIKQGYKELESKKAINYLKQRMNENKLKNNFPHEIGLFLNYPIQDVKGFIKNKGRNCRCCGYWKVYEEEEKALSMFAKFDKCKLVYKRMCSQGISINKLTIAC